MSPGAARVVTRSVRPGKSRAGRDDLSHRFQGFIAIFEVSRCGQTCKGKLTLAPRFKVKGIRRVLFFLERLPLAAPG